MPPINPAADDKSSKSMEKMAKVTEALTKKINDLEKSLKNFGNTTKKTSDITVKGFEEIDEVVENVDEDIEKASKLMNQLQKQKFDTKKLDKYKDRFNKITKNVDLLKKRMAKASKSDKVALKEKMRGQILVLNNMRDEMSTLSKTQKGWGKSIGVAKDFSKAISAAPDVMSVLGTITKSSGKLVGNLLGKFAGPAGLAVTAVKAIWDIGMAADQFVKDANKSFASIRGPDIMTDDMKSQFKDFNDQIFNMGENLRVGLNVTQIRELMGAIAQAGLNITTLNQGVTSYRDAIYVASKASKALGVDLTLVGSYMGKMITDFRMDLDKVDKTFNLIAFDAKKSGLSTDRFWNVIQNANASLALYGVAIKTASKVMKRFTEDNIGGAEDAARANEDMFNLFKSGSIEAQAAILDFARKGGADINKMFQEQIDELSGRTTTLKFQIKGLREKGSGRTSAETEQLKKLEKEFSESSTMQKRFQDVVGKKSIEQATEMGALAKDAPELLMAAIKRITDVGDISQITGQKMIVATKVMSKFGLQENTVRMFVEEAKNTRINMENFSKEFTNFSGVTDKNLNDLLDLGKKSGDEQIIGITEVQKSLEENTSMGATNSELLAEAAAVSQEVRDAIKKGDAIALQQAMSSSKTIEKITNFRYKRQEMTDDQLAASSDKTLDKMVDLTMSYNEALDIAKQDVQWRANNLSLLTGLNKWTMDIFYFLTKDAKGYRSESQKMAQKELEAAISSDASLAKILNFDEDGNISLESQRAILENLAKRMDAAGGGGAGKAVKALERASGAKDPLMSIDASIASLESSMKEEKDPIKLKALTYARDQIALAKKGDKFDQEAVAKQILALKKQDEEYNTAQGMETKLETLNDVNKDIAKYQKLQLMGSGETKKYLTDEVTKAMASKDPAAALKGLSTTTGLSIEELYKAGGGGLSGENKSKMLREAYKHFKSRYGIKTKEEFGGHLEEEGVVDDQNFDSVSQRRARVFTRRGLASFKAGEMIAGKDFAKTVPYEATPMARTGTGGQGVTNHWYIHATENLAGEIKNIVRSVVNKEGYS